MAPAVPYGRGGGGACDRPRFGILARVRTSVVVAEVVRDGVVESVHHGVAALTGPDGALEFALGDPSTPILPRSTLKPVQALAMVRAGASPSAPQLALACASHSGEPVHLEVVRSTLADAGLDESALRNTPDLPLGEAERLAWLAAGRPPSSLAQNCSGKHALMLAAGVANGWPTDSYLDPAGPCQRAVRRTLDELGITVHAEVTDGCGAVNHAIALADLARILGRFAAAGGGLERRVADAMRAHPDLVAGTGRDATAIMRAIPGCLAKDGAEGVYAVGLADGRGVALKIADGAARARPVVLGALLRRLGAGTPELWATLADAPVLGHGRPVGAVRATAS